MDSVFNNKGWTNWCQIKGTPFTGNSAVVQSAATSSTCVPACRKLDGVAARLMNGVAALFFMTLERCSCIYLDTKDDPDDANNYLPLTFTNNEHLQHNVHEEVLQKNGVSDN